MAQFQISVIDLKEGDRLVFAFGVMLYVEDVTFTRDGKVKVSVGYDGTGTQWYDREERVYIER